jgi:hypothetical protein
VFADGVYFELISFTHPASHHPPGSPGRVKRDSNPWASRSPGWIDFADEEESGARKYDLYCGWSVRVIMIGYCHFLTALHATGMNRLIDHALRIIVAISFHLCTSLFINNRRLIMDATIIFNTNMWLLLVKFSGGESNSRATESQMLNSYRYSFSIRHRAFCFYVVCNKPGTRREMRC